MDGSHLHPPNRDHVSARCTAKSVCLSVSRASVLSVCLDVYIRTEHTHVSQRACIHTARQNQICAFLCSPPRESVRPDADPRPRDEGLKLACQVDTHVSPRYRRCTLLYHICYVLRLARERNISLQLETHSDCFRGATPRGTPPRSWVAGSLQEALRRVLQPPPKTQLEPVISHAHGRRLVALGAARCGAVQSVLWAWACRLRLLPPSTTSKGKWERDTVLGSRPPLPWSTCSY